MVDTEEKITLREIPWPYNLIEVVGGWLAAGDPEIGQIGNLDFTAKGILALANAVLTPRELSIIETRYKGGGKTLKETGKLHGIQAERCRQIEARALRKLTGPKLNQYASVPWKCWKAERDARIAAEAREKEANERLRWVLSNCTYRMKSGIDPIETLEEVGRAAEKNMTIEDMDLSVRSFNCLRRAGINTMNDLLKIPTEEDAMHIRNLGRKSWEEIKNKVHSLGYRLMWES